MKNDQIYFLRITKKILSFWDILFFDTFSKTDLINRLIFFQRKSLNVNSAYKIKRLKISFFGKEIFKKLKVSYINIFKLILPIKYKNNFELNKTLIIQSELLRKELLVEENRIKIEFQKELNKVRKSNKNFHFSHSIEHIINGNDYTFLKYIFIMITIIIILGTIWLVFFNK